MRIRISLPQQTLELHDELGMLLRRYRVSTAKNGPGEQNGSFCTPRGRHIVRAKVGAGATANTVFVRRRPTGETWTPQLAEQLPGRDWILTRILWLSGKEPGRNRLGEVDTMRRYIYLHGSPDTVAMGTPGSIGCVRMHNSDIIELFDLVPARTPVDIVEFGLVSGSWDELGGPARQVRESVFVEEQNVPREIELDEHDAVSRHVIARDADGGAIGTGRLLADGHIGRMAVLAGWPARASVAPCWSACWKRRPAAACGTWPCTRRRMPAASTAASASSRKGRNSWKPGFRTGPWCAPAKPSP